MELEAVFSKGRGPQNLDRHVLTPHFVAVFDGCTPKSNDAHRAQEATAELVDRLVRAVRAMPPELGEDELLLRLVEASQQSSEYDTSASGAIYSRFLRRVLVVGDAWVGVDGANHRFRHDLEDVHSQLRAAHNALALAKGTDSIDLRRDDLGRAVIEPLLRRECEFRNVDAPGAYFFAAFDGQVIPAALVRRVEVPPTTGRLTLCTDGYPSLGTSLLHTEALLAERVRRDPLMMSGDPRTKGVPLDGDGYDDRTYLAVRLNTAHT